VKPAILAVIGGTTTLSREVVRQAAAAGHIVNVLARTRRSPDDEVHSTVTYIDGDVRDAASVDRTVAPADAVICTIDHRNHDPRDLLTQITGNALAAMDRHDVSRIVVISGTSVRSPDDAPTRWQRLTSTLVSIAPIGPGRDRHRQVALLTASDTDWTVVRAPRIVERPATGRYRVGSLDASTGTVIGDGDLASFLIACAETGAHVRAMPLVSY
jgi:putative NADH-flavin reductase